MKGNNRFQKKKVIRKKISVMVTVLLTVGMLFTGILPGDLFLREASAESVYTTVFDEDHPTRTFEGEFTEENKDQRQEYSIRIDETSRFHFRIKQCATDFMCIRIRDITNGNVVSQNMGWGISSATKDYDFYLTPGAYTVSLGYPNVTGYGKKYGKYKIYMWILSTGLKEGSEPEKDQKNWKQAANIELGQTYRGSYKLTSRIWADKERYYRFYPKLPGGSITLSLKTNAEIISWQIFGKNENSNEKELAKGQNGKWVSGSNGNHDEYRLNTYQINLEQADEYYLRLELGQGSGIYDIKITENYDSTGIFPYQYILPGEYQDPVPKGYKDRFQVSDIYCMDLSSEKQVLTFDGNRLKGLKQGEIQVKEYGYLGDSGKTFRYTLPVVVEYTDVRYGSYKTLPYYYDPVYWAATGGITGGVKDPDGVVRRFDPNGICTRGQMVAFLWRMSGCPEPKTVTDYTDVKKSDYFYKAVSWAQEEGITGGYSDKTFRPQGKCTRAQTVSFLYRMAGTPSVNNHVTSFSDVKSGLYYSDAVIWAQQNEITGGYSDGTFRPNGTCTRAQMVTFLYRYDQQW